jgi:NAD(P)-dependent dehydrogenase (short-subunit alcohol dehydrogenase family)
MSRPPYRGGTDISYEELADDHGGALGIPPDRLAKPREAADVIAFLASGRASSITNRAWIDGCTVPTM